jgi:PhoPQ-activated pathogenicity-related protein
MVSLLLGLILGAPNAPHELYDFLSRKDPGVSWKVLREDKGQTEIELNSLIWQGTSWKHGMLIQQPSKVEFKGTGVLFITGDGPFAGDRNQIRLLSAATGMPVAMLFGIPNQPLWNMREDDLIAYTFQKYLETQDASWPLLFPMTKSAIRAMDAVVDVTKNTDNPIKRFVVTGASKRGWTTWFVGAAGDKRVVGIAPMVYDNLNISIQMPHQLSAWGQYSEMIQDYTRRGLQAKMATPVGQKLTRMVDPFAYRDRIKVPTLIVTGGNDPYWAADATRQYWGDLKMPKYDRVIPNVSHDLGGGFVAIETIGMFARSLAGAFKMPEWTATTSRSDANSLITQFDIKGAGFLRGFIWVNASPTLDFRKSAWVKTAEIGISAPTGKEGARPTVKYLIPAGQNAAILAEARFRFGGREFSLTQPVEVFKSR